MAMKVAYLHTDLMVGFRNGDEAAIKQLYDQHYRALCYYAEQLVQDKAEAEDIAVDTFLKLLNKKADFDNLPDIKSFLFTATRNACFDVLRRNKRLEKSNKELEYLAEPDEMFGQQEMITAKVLQVIYAEVENLPAQCRQVFKSIFIESKSTAAIAAEMGISTQTVLNQKSKALQFLRLSLYKENLFSAGMFLYCLSVIGGSHKL
jgi:RNA polymerase sigma-70 factor (ECF subfamily)